MNKSSLEKYAILLVDYCCAVKPGQNILIRSSVLAESLVLACQKQILLRGANCELSIGIQSYNKQYYEHASDHQLDHIPVLYQHSIEVFDAIISISAPHDLFELKGSDESKIARHQSALKPVKSMMMQRSKDNELNWVICNFPTESLAQAANMTLQEYERFISDACFLNQDDPTQKWRELSLQQETYVNRLNQSETIQFVSDHVDIIFSTQGRIWINSDGKRNMPSGEVFTSPVESSGNGSITFTHPSLLFGEVIQDLTLTIVDGLVVEWDTKNGQALLDRLFDVDGANKIGEIAIGTNYAIKKPTLNTLFDEKIGGTIHMAVGASYPETGGQNQSSIHHDFVTQFDFNSRILLDGDCVYENGKWTI